jgi:hypothetical protein
MGSQPQFTAFERNEQLVSGSRAKVIGEIRARLSKQPQATIFIFDDATGAQVDFDLRETEEHRISAPSLSKEEPRAPGRPKLGVVAREITLLPRHWDWLATQPGGASVTLRKLVDEARRANAGSDKIRESQERTYRFMSAMAGNFPGFEEACRALFGKDRSRFEALTAKWPRDVRAYACTLADGAFSMKD